jgi:nicotinamidase-related amidase
METKKYSERLTPENAVLLLIDHQVGLFTGVRDIPVAELKHNVVALAKAVMVLGVPIIVTATSPEMWGPIIPELTEALPGISIINRTTVNAFDEPRFAKAVEATGRKKLIIAGVSTEVCLALPAIHATGAGYDTYAVIDASGTFSETKRITGLLRMVQACPANTRPLEATAYGMISSDAILSPSSLKKYRRSTGLPGKFPTRWLVTTIFPSFASHAKGSLVY